MYKRDLCINHLFVLLYRVHQEQAHSIKCYAADGSPAQPLSLINHQKIITAAADKRGHVKNQQQKYNEQSGEDLDKSQNVKIHS